MGVIVDTNVFITFERRGVPIDLSPWSPAEDVFISAVTVSELLIGVHRADSPTRKARRAEFVDRIVAAIPVLDFTTAVARRHAQLWADLAARGQLIGSHDLLIAATAVTHDLSLLTDNHDEFSRVQGIKVVPFS